MFIIIVVNLFSGVRVCFCVFVCLCLSMLWVACSYTIYQKLCLSTIFFFFLLYRLFYLLLMFIFWKLFLLCSFSRFFIFVTSAPAKNSATFNFTARVLALLGCILNWFRIEFHGMRYLCRAGAGCV